MTFDLDKLHDFIEADEGSAPPVFVGREAIFEDIERTGSRAWIREVSLSDDAETTVSGAPKNTRIVQGAPGAGKTSLLTELVRRSAERDGALGQPRVLTFASSEIIESLPQVLRAIAAAGSLPQSRWRDFLPRLAVGLDGTGLPSISFATNRASDIRAPKTLSDLALQHPRDTWQAPIIVAIDEAQTLPANATDPHALFFNGVHQALRGLPLTLVLAGLGDTRHNARCMGLTRLGNIHEIGGLEEVQAKELMRDFCLHFGIEPSRHEAYLDALTGPCEGWPRHLHFAMQALAGEAGRCGGDLAGVDWDRCHDEAAQSRVRYYRGQQSQEMTYSVSLVAGVMQSLLPDMTLADVAETVWKLDREHGDTSPKWRLPDGMSATGFCEHLVHQGALQERADQTVYCPIPSFRTHLLGAGGLSVHAA